MNKIYAISDIHGCSKTFVELLNQISLNQSDKLYLLGDYIDRGPGSIETIDKIIELRNSGYNIDCLTGNHEQMMLTAFKRPSEADIWLYNGGASVLDELGLHSVKQIPQKYIDFLQSLNYHFETNDFIFVHAGVDLENPNPLSDKDSLIWIRNWENPLIVDSFLQGKKIIHGHTPQKRIDIEKRFDLFVNGYNPVLNIDCGCVFTKYEGYGNLCCVNLTDNKLHFQRNID